MSRQEKRKAERQANSIIKNAKSDMVKWVQDIGYVPTETEAKAWQEGYLAGINRMNKYKEEAK
jgi:hypothetical protein